MIRRPVGAFGLDLIGVGGKQSRSSVRASGRLAVALQLERQSLGILSAQKRLAEA